jgi:hypothetical protein
VTGAPDSHEAAPRDDDEFTVQEGLFDALTELLHDDKGVSVDGVGRFVADVSEVMETCWSAEGPAATGPGA